MSSTASPLVAGFVALQTQERTAILDERQQVSFAQLLQRSTRLAHGLLKQAGQGSLKGKRVALLGPPDAEWVARFLAVIFAGGVVVPIATMHPEPEVQHALSVCKPAKVWLHSGFAERRGWFGAYELELYASEADFSPAAQGSGLSLTACEASDPAVMLFTSGSTGKPKGAPLSHRNLAQQWRALAEVWELCPQDRLLHFLPLHHLHGLSISLLTTLFAGGSARMLPRFDAAAVWNGLEEVSVLMAVPAIYHRLFAFYDQASATEQSRWREAACALRLATSGSAALPLPLAERWQKLTGEIPVERYGMTEIGVALSNPLYPPRKRGHVGKPLPGTELRLVDGRGQPVADGQPGEIVVKGPAIFDGYFERPDATAEAFEAGWFRTGDLAQKTASGEVRILGRLSVDILKSGGYKISALEIEDALRGHRAVSEVAVVGLPDPAWGQKIVALVVPTSEWQARPEEALVVQLREHCKQALAGYKVPKEFLFAEALPRNAMGKVVKPQVSKTCSAHLGVDLGQGASSESTGSLRENKG